MDGAIFLATATALAAAELHNPAPPRQRTVAIPAVLAAIPIGGLIATWQPGTLPVTTAVALTGPPMLLLALTTGGNVERTDVTRWWPWAAAGIAICLWELTSFLQQKDPQTASRDHPTLSAVLEPMFAGGPGRTAMVIVWLAAGIALARLMLGARRCTR
jgi:hypothetical protein